MPVITLPVILLCTICDILCLLNSRWKNLLGACVILICICMLGAMPTQNNFYLIWFDLISFYMWTYLLNNCDVICLIVNARSLKSWGNVCSYMFCCTCFNVCLLHCDAFTNKTRYLKKNKQYVKGIAVLKYIWRGIST